MTTENILKRNGTIWIVSTSGWTGNDRLRANDLGLSEDQVPDDLFKLGNKHLISDEWRIKLTGTSSKLSAFMQRVGRPTPLGRGIYWIPDGLNGENLMLAVQGFERIETEQQAVVQGFLSVYEEEKASRIQQYPVLADAVWPTPSQILSKFRVRKIVLQGLEGVGVKETDPTDLIAAKQVFNAELQSAYEEYVQGILQEIHEAIIDSCIELHEKVMEAGDKVTETTLKKPRAVLDKYLTIARWFDLDQVTQAVVDLKTTLAQKAKPIRDDWSVRQEFAEAIRVQADQIGDLVGINSQGRTKRKVKTV